MKNLESIFLSLNSEDLVRIMSALEYIIHERKYYNYNLKFIEPYEKTLNKLYGKEN